MFRTHVCFPLFGFLAVVCFASVGFAQEFYQPMATYSAPTSYQALPTQSFPVQSFPVQGFPSQGFPVALGASSFTGAQAQSYNFSDVPTQAYAGIQSPVVSGHGALPHIISPDYGYDGPGDMRTHLWNDHANDLKVNGVSQAKLMSMPMATVQKWHNFFHGTQGRPQQ